jgi:hypothetical protein
MQAIYAFGLLILIAFLGARFITKRTSLSPVNYFFYSGFIYIFLGLSLGRSGWEVLSPSILSGLTPLIGLGLGWAGFISQAGVALGMAIIIQDNFPNWGSEFMALVLAIIAINQIIGPVFLQRLLIRVNEAGKKE